jgi:hypothetical protein
MSTTTFVNGVTLTDADWFNDVDALIYDVFNEKLTAGSAGTILRSDGTHILNTTATYPNAITDDRILVATAANVIGESGSNLTYDGTTLTVGTLSVTGSATIGDAVADVHAVSGQINFTDDGVGALFIRSGGGDVLQINPSTAANGTVISSLNSATTDYEPVTFGAENYSFNYRIGAGSLAVGMTLNAPDGKVTVNTQSVLPAQFAAAFDSELPTEGWAIAAASETTPAKQVGIGYDIINDYGFVASLHSGTSWKSLKLNPIGGDVYVSNGLYVPVQSSAVNYLYVRGGVTGDGVRLFAQGTDTNVPLYTSSKGIGTLGFYTRDGTSPTFFVNDSGFVNANHLAVQGNPSGNGPRLIAGGTDTNIRLYIDAKGNESIRFRTNEGAQTGFVVGHTASSVNFYQVLGNTTGAGPILLATGTDSNVDSRYYTSGTGSHYFASNSGSVSNFSIINNGATDVNFIQAWSTPSAAYPQFRATGSDAQVGFNFYTKGSGSYIFNTDVGGTPSTQFAIAHTASAVNYVQITGAATAANAELSSQGSDTNIGINYTTKGSGVHFFRTNSGGQNQFAVSHTASAVNYVVATGSATGNPVQIYTEGTDANAGLQLLCRGAGTVSIGSGTNGVQFRVDTTASASRFIIVTGSNGGNPSLNTSAGSLAITPAVVTAAGMTVGTTLSVGTDLTVGGASIPQNSKSAAYTTVAADANKHIYHPTTDNNARTFTIDSNANVPYAIGTCLTFVNDINTVTIAITSDTLVLAGVGTTGSRTLAANGVATAVKVTSTRWVISGTGLS